MRKLSLLGLIAAALVFNSAVASAKSLNDRAQRLGGDKELIRKTRAMDPKNRFRVVQKRAVDRYWRLEFGGNYGMHAWSDPYAETSTFGGYADLHINPRWSLGVRYAQHENQLSAEGQRILNEFRAGLNPNVRGIDLPDSSTMGVVSFYPLYGKLNWFDSSVAQFDVYLLGGGGQIDLASGSAPSWTAGGGVGIWLNNHFSSRVEVRYQAYEDQLFDGSTRDQNFVVTTFSIGVLL